MFRVWVACAYVCGYETNVRQRVPNESKGESRRHDVVVCSGMHWQTNTRGREREREGERESVRVHALDVMQVSTFET